MMSLFPRGVATGDAFYDRAKERARLKKNITKTLHTVLIAPRRFGKTSLMNQVLIESNAPHIWLDFMTVTNRSEAEEKLLEKISLCVSSLASTPEKLKAWAEKYFLAMKPEVTFSIPTLLSLKLSAPSKNPQQSIMDALMQLDALAQDIQQQIVIVFDEFQEIARIDEDATLQGSIRHAAERSKKTTYLFSGSKHRPLKKLFNGKESPLYALCDLMTIQKIDPSDYQQFLDTAAMQRWGHPLSEPLFQQILSHTECYPKYINALCGELWSLDEEEPNLGLVDTLWHDYVLSRKTEITVELSDLNLSQRRLLRFLAQESTSALYSHHVLSHIQLPQSSVQRAIEVLLDKDLVYEEEGHYQVLDPALKYYLKHF